MEGIDFTKKDPEVSESIPDDSKRLLLLNGFKKIFFDPESFVNRQSGGLPHITSLIHRAINLYEQELSLYSKVQTKAIVDFVESCKDFYEKYHNYGKQKEINEFNSDSVFKAELNLLAIKFRETLRSIYDEDSKIYSVRDIKMHDKVDIKKIKDVFYPLSCLEDYSKNNSNYTKAQMRKVILQTINAYEKLARENQDIFIPRLIAEMMFDLKYFFWLDNDWAQYYPMEGVIENMKDRYHKIKVILNRWRLDDAKINQTE